MGKHPYVRVEPEPKPRRPKPVGLITHAGRRRRASSLHRLNQRQLHEEHKLRRAGKPVNVIVARRGE
jgi:hypothetical protein